MRAACEQVVSRSADVSIGPLDDVLAAIRERPVPAWDGRRHFAGERGRTVAYIFVLDATNFSFWGGPGGYWKLAEGIRDCYRAGDELSDPDHLSRITAAELAGWIGELPLLEERSLSLRQLGGLVAAELGGDFTALIQPTATATAANLSRRLESFRDVATYAGAEVPILKRAQIVAADLAGAGLAAFPDLADLTCFADYKLPQVLRELGALAYSERLARRIDDWQELAPGEPAEVEIRAATIVAVERLRSQLAAGGRDLCSYEVDWLLWALSQELFPMRPHPRVRTIYY